MKVKELRDLMKELPDDADVVLLNNMGAAPVTYGRGAEAPAFRHIVRVDGVGSIQFNDKQIRPVKTKDFQVGDKVVTERLGHVVVKAIYEDCVRVQASDGRFFDVLSTALCFEAGYKRQNTEHKDKNSGDREMK